MLAKLKRFASAAPRSARVRFMEPLLIYLGLFGTSFLAATLVPAQSEAVLFALLMTGSCPAWLLLLAPSVGNIMGSCVNWLLGVGFTRFEEQRWFPRPVLGLGVPSPADAIFPLT